LTQHISVWLCLCVLNVEGSQDMNDKLHRLSDACGLVVDLMLLLWYVMLSFHSRNLVLYLCCTNVVPYHSTCISMSTFASDKITSWLLMLHFLNNLPSIQSVLISSVVVQADTFPPPVTKLALHPPENQWFPPNLQTRPLIYDQITIFRISLSLRIILTLFAFG